MFTETYNIAIDFISLIGPLPYLALLEEEILEYGSAGLTAKFLYGELIPGSSPTDCLLTFTSSLTAPEKAALDAVIAAHVGFVSNPDPPAGPGEPGGIATLDENGDVPVDQISMSGVVQYNADLDHNVLQNLTVGHPHTQYQQTSEKGVAGGYAALDGGGKVPAAQIPAVALPEVFIVADETARLALTVQEGDEAKQTNDGSHWVYDGSTWHEYPGPDDVDEDKIIHVGKHGNDGNDGKTIDKAVLTFGQAVTLVNAETPSSSNIWSIVCLDAGIYTETITLTNGHIHVFAANATLSGSIVVVDDTSVEFEMVVCTSGTAVTKSAGSETTYVEIKKLDTNGCDGFNNSSTGVLNAEVEFYTQTGGIGLQGTSGIIHADIQDWDLYGASPVAVKTIAGTLNLRAANIADRSGSGTSIAFDCNGGVTNSLAVYVSADTCYEVETGATLNLIIAACSGAENDNGGTINVTTAGGVNTHGLGGASHSSSTLAQLNDKVSDATLIDTADSRLSDTRDPNAHNHTLADITDSGDAAARNTGMGSGNVVKVGPGGLAANEVMVTNGAGNAETDPQGTAFNKAFGIGAGTVCEGDDFRLHDALTLGGVANDTTDDTLDLTAQSLTVNLATGSTDGAMSATDKTKLDFITVASGVNLDNDFVHITGAENVAGVKTWTNTIESLTTLGEDNLVLEKSNSTTSWSINAGRIAFYDNWLLFKNSAESSNYTFAISSNGAFRGKAGSAGAPTYTFDNASNYGMSYDDGPNEGLVLSSEGHPRLRIEDDGTLSVAGTPDYETLVLADDDIPNKKYVDDSSGGDVSASANIGDHEVVRGDGGVKGVQGNTAGIFTYDDSSRVTIEGNISGQMVTITNNHATLGEFVRCVNSLSNGVVLINKNGTEDGIVTVYNSLETVKHFTVEGGHVKMGRGAADIDTNCEVLINGPVAGGNGLCILAGEALGDIILHLNDQDDSFGGTGGAIMEVEADQGYVTFFKTYAQTLIDRGVVHGVDQQNPDGGVKSDYNTEFGGYRVAGVRVIENDADIAQVKNIRYAGEHDNGNSGTTPTVNWNNGNKQRITLTANATVTLTALTDGVSNLLLKIVQDGAGSRLITWPAAVKWPGGTAPTLTTTPGATDIVSFYWDGTSYFGVASLAFA